MAGGMWKSGITPPAYDKLTLQSKRIDLAFVMDCTGSMDSYIEQAQKNVIKIAEELKRKKADYRFALVEYRDHQQEGSAGNSGFITRVINFTEHLKEIQRRFDECTAEGVNDLEVELLSPFDLSNRMPWMDLIPVGKRNRSSAKNPSAKRQPCIGLPPYMDSQWRHNITHRPTLMLHSPTHILFLGGGDPPEAIADALSELLNLSWREPAVKVCVFIADSPPHGLGYVGDQFASGCPCGKDPMEIAHKLAEKKVMVYTVGCEPSVTPYKDWFMAISHITSGQYLPLASAIPLFQAIMGAVFDGLSLSDIAIIVGTILMTSNRTMTEDETVDLVTKQLSGSITKQLESDKGAIQKPTPQALELAKLHSMADVRKIFKPVAESSSSAAEVITVTEGPVKEEHVRRAVRLVFASSHTGSTMMTSPDAEFVKL